MNAIVRRPIFALAIGAAVVLAACSGSSPAATSAAGQQAPAGASQGPVASAAPAASSDGSGDSDSCTSIVTTADVGTAAGFPIANTSGAGGICYFQAADPSKYLVVWIFGSQDAMASMLQIESGSQHVDGLGDDAFWSGAGGILFVRKGDKGIEFQDPDFVFTPDSNTAPRDALVTLAKTALPNL
ncbi:MAG TPA: hypothetical protein VKR24_04650 [Candidatus Limnocylindrales bacterium]|nr:hypothetical protein [Candidatus Limnocylindrales bacterium]